MEKDRKPQYEEPKLEDLSKKKTKGQAGWCLDGSGPPGTNCEDGTGATVCSAGTGD
jgi:hypothetical protein